MEQTQLHKVFEKMYYGWTVLQLHTRDPPKKRRISVVNDTMLRHGIRFLPSIQCSQRLQR